MTTATAKSRNRADIPVEYTWNLADIYPDWETWEADRAVLDARIDEYAALKGTLAQGPGQLLKAFELGDAMGKLAHTVYYFPSLKYDEDQRNNDINARRQTVESLLARWQQATSWFSPELLTIPLVQAREWMDANPDLALYRFAIEEVYRLQEHVLDEPGERLLSLAARVTNAPHEAYGALSTSDAKFPDVTLSTGETVKMSYGQYRAVLAGNRNQADRRLAFLAHYGTYNNNLNTYASIYHSVCQRDWFQARARGYGSSIEAALHGNAIPVAVVENLIAAARAGAEPMRRYHRFRRKRLNLEHYYPYDFSIPIVEWDRKYDYASIAAPIVDAVAPLGSDYQARMRRGFSERWIDVFENDGKRSGAYSASVYGKHPYMLMNWNETLDDVFTMAHEMGHSMHTMFSHETQPFVYAEYTIFVAEVASTLNEALLLDHMLERAENPTERSVLLQHAIDNITSTFYTQVMFADFELQVHRKVERDEPVTAEVLNAIYKELSETYYADAVELEELTPITWARIPHFYNSPFYVYQYATCFASAAKLSKTLMDPEPGAREIARQRYLSLLSSGGNDHPMTQLQKAGVDLTQPDTVAAVVQQLDKLVTQLEQV
ncbi:MAG TPA: oligoendopeptidase F [Vicinamibacterales bacterium]|nr:oligoendopeptidase F [Vicinamibacterales bacterium]